MNDYSEVVEAKVRPAYYALDLTESNATVVANAKALHHLVSDLIPPIDRQYTIRFFTQSQDRWFDSNGKFSGITLPAALLDLAWRYTDLGDVETGRAKG